MATAGDDLTGAGRHAEAGEAYRAAAALAPDNHELLFWAGLAEFDHGDRAAGLAQVRRAIALQPGWLALLGRLEARRWRRRAAGACSRGASAQCRNTAG